jgi:hypothetical protein
LTKRVEEATPVGLSITEQYINALDSFGGVTTSPPSKPLAYDLFSWMKSNFAKLPGFVGGVVDFGALSSTTNLSKVLAKSGYPHVKGLKEKKDFESPAELGESSGNLAKSMRNFMKLFWLKFGCVDARSLVEARRAAVR